MKGIEDVGSSDKGFDASIAMAQKLNIDCVMRFNTINGAVKDYEKHLAEYAAEQDAEDDAASEEEHVVGEDDKAIVSDEVVHEVIVQEASEELPEAPVQEVNEEFPETIAQEESAESHDTENDAAGLVRKLLGQEGELLLSQDKLDIVCEGIIKSSTKMEKYKFLRHELGNRDGRIVYGAVCDSWAELVVMAS